VVAGWRYGEAAAPDAAAAPETSARARLVSRSHSAVAWRQSTATMGFWSYVHGRRGSVLGGAAEDLGGRDLFAGALPDLVRRVGVPVARALRVRLAVLPRILLSLKSPNCTASKPVAGTPSARGMPVGAGSQPIRSQYAAQVTGVSASQNAPSSTACTGRSSGSPSSEPIANGPAGT